MMITKEQIQLVTLETDNAERFVLRECSIRRKTADGEGQTMEMEGLAAEALWADICSMIPEPPEADTQPYRNTAVMQDGSKLRLPREALEQRLVQAWDETELHLEMIRQSFQAPNVMGLVAFDPTPKGNPPMSVDAFFGMGMLQNPPPAHDFAGTNTSKSVRIDSEAWSCKCGAADQHGKFCTECGYPAPPQQPEPWDCPGCGAKALTSKFCSECGTPAPGQA